MLIFRVHAVQQMFRRGISEVEVRDVIENGEVIEQYPDDSPHPAMLTLGWIELGAGKLPLHVVSSFDHTTGTTYVVTVYEPDSKLWEDGFRRRKDS